MQNYFLPLSRQEKSDSRPFGIHIMNILTKSRLLMSFASVAILGGLILLGGFIVVPGSAVC